MQGIYKIITGFCLHLVKKKYLRLVTVKSSFVRVIVSCQIAESAALEASQADSAVSDGAVESADTSGFEEESFNCVAPLDDEMQDASLEPAIAEPAAKDTSDVENASTGNNSLSVSLFVHTDDLQDDLDEDLRAVENGMEGGSEGKEIEESPEKGLLTHNHRSLDFIVLKETFEVHVYSTACE